MDGVIFTAGNAASNRRWNDDTADSSTTQCYILINCCICTSLHCTASDRNPWKGRDWEKGESRFGTQSEPGLMWRKHIFERMGPLHVLSA